MQTPHIGHLIAPPGSANRGGEQLSSFDFLIACRRGQVRYRIGGAVVGLDPGDLLFIRRGLPPHHWQVDAVEWEVIWLGLQLSDEERALMAYPPHASGMVHLRGRAELERILQPLLDRLVALRQHEDSGSAAIRQHLVPVVLYEINRFHGPPQRPGDPVVAAALDHIDRHLADPELDLRSIVAAVSCSRSLLLRRFGAAMGQGPMHHLEARRLDIAAAQLRSSAAPVASIARAVGYRDARYFATRFRRRHGCTPSDWRDRHGP